MRSITQIALCFLALVATYKTAVGQGGLLQGRVINTADRTGIPQVHVKLKGEKNTFVTQADGRFAIPADDRKKVQLVFTHVGFTTVDTTVRNGNDLLIPMTRKVEHLPEVVIATPAPEVVFESKEWHVASFEVNDEGVWILAYDRPRLLTRVMDVGKGFLEDVRLVLLDNDFNTIAERTLPQAASGLHVDFTGRLYVLGEFDVFLAAWSDLSITLERIDRTAFDEGIKPWTDSIAGRLIGSTFDPTYPEFEHIAYSPEEGRTEMICSIVDEHRLGLFRSQYKYMSGPDKVVAMNLAAELGSDKETVAGYMTGFANDPYFEPPFAPLFVVDDSLLVFDHCNEVVQCFDQDLQEISSRPLVTAQRGSRVVDMIQDRANGSVYSLQRRNARVHIVAALLGEMIHAIEHPYPAQVRVHGGWAYYVYRPFGSLQKKTLYREEIR